MVSPEASRELVEAIEPRTGISGSAERPKIHQRTTRVAFARCWRTQFLPGGTMRASIIAGIILLVLGAVIVFRGMSYKTTNEVAHVGDVKITDTDQHGIPQWVGIAGIVGGVILIGAGATKKF